MYDVVIIGAGIAGTFIARELSRYQLDVLLLDRQNDVANETTAANSAIVHAGYDAKYGELKGKFNAPGNAMYAQVCEELDVPFSRCGSLLIGFNEKDRSTIENLYENGLKNGVPDMQILEADEVKAMEPNLNKSVLCALYAPTAGIVSPWELAIALAENAMDNGVTLKLETSVENIKKHENSYTVITDKGEFETKYIINCAGVHTDTINNMVTEPYFEIHPRKGNYYILDKDAKDLVKHVIFQCPTKKGKGIILAPTVHGNVIVGPDSEFVHDKDSVDTEADALNYVKESALLTCPSIPFYKSIRTFAGLRATSNTGDFIIEEAKGAKGFINVAGFESPGLSAIPSVTQHVVSLLREIAGALPEKEDFNPRRRKVVRFVELSEKEKEEQIKENPKFGKVICRCETVTEAEIVDCIHRNAGARTVKAVKKRVRPGSGRCQGGFCEPRIVEILSRELGKEMTDISYDSSKSYILTGETKSNQE